MTINDSTRRSFVGSAIGLTLGAIAVDALAEDSSTSSGGVQDISDRGDNKARQNAYQLRVNVAKQNRDATPTNLQHPDNGDEALYPNKIGTFTKGLQHDDNAEVVASSYRSLITALNSRASAAFEDIALGGPRLLTNPQAGLAYALEGGDSRSFVQPPPPAFASADQAGDIAENYWMALLRDVPFADYATHPVAAAAAADLTLFGSAAKVPKEHGVVTPELLFRGLTPGDRVGPYLSQFFYLPMSFGANVIDQQIVPYAAGVDYLTTFPEYLAVQRGAATPAPLAGSKSYMHNGRHIGKWVHVDVLYQGYFHAALVLLGLGAPLNRANPYTHSRTQAPFGTLGAPHITGLLGEFAVRALQNVWYQKWFVHRRIRPEAFGARVHQTAFMRRRYPVHASILDSVSSRSRLGGYLAPGNGLLPIAFPEGSPTHPSYGAGHATVAGACVTLLKAWFDGSFVIPNPKMPNHDGTALVDYVGPPLTVEGELNKVASNVALGRNHAGMHWRSDATESLKLGEAVGIQLLREIRQTLNEPITFAFNGFDGTPITI